MRYIITLAFATTPALAEVPAVVTDIPPVHALVSEVMGDLGQPVLLLERGADEHDFQLRPSQSAAVADADLVVWIGPELTPWLDSAMDTRPEGASALALLAGEGTVTRAYGESGDDHDHAEEDHDHAKEDHDHGAEGHDHAEEGHDHAKEDHDHAGEGHDHAEEGHDHAGEGHDHAAEGHDHAHAHDGTDPHAWLDPGNARTWLSLIAAELSRLDPANTAAYTANAEAAAQRIDALDAELAAILEPVKGKPLVTFHDAYGYFGDHYGLTFAGSIALGDATSPGAKRLSELRATMEAGEVLCIFPEAQHDPALVTQMAEGTGARIGGVLDPVGSTLEPGPGAFAALLTGMATTLADCVAG
jgi:zinc transport system substrate-binding protein